MEQNPRPTKKFRTFQEAAAIEQKQRSEFEAYFSVPVNMEALELVEKRHEAFKKVLLLHAGVERLFSLKPDDTERWPESYSCYIRESAMHWVKLFKGERKSTVTEVFHSWPEYTRPIYRDEVNETKQTSADGINWYTFWNETDNIEQVGEFLEMYEEHTEIMKAAIYLYYKDLHRKEAIAAHTLADFATVKDDFEMPYKQRLRSCKRKEPEVEDFMDEEAEETNTDEYEDMEEDEEDNDLDLADDYYDEVNVWSDDD